MRFVFGVSCCLSFLVPVYGKTDSDSQKADDRHCKMFKILRSLWIAGGEVFKVDKLSTLSEIR